MGAARIRLLIAVDGSDQSMDAVKYAVNMVPREAFEIVLFHVFSKIPESHWDLEKNPQMHQNLLSIRSWEMKQEEMIGQFMQRARETIVKAGFPAEDVQLRTQERKEGIARDILAESRKGYVAVVAARRGGNRLWNSLFMGSVTNKLVERISHTSVWIASGAPLGNKILIALDNSEGAMKAVAHVRRVFSGAPREIMLFHAVRRPQPFSMAAGEAFFDEMETAKIDEAKSVMDSVFREATAQLVEGGVSESAISTKIITGVGSRAESIVGEAVQGGYGTIVVGRRGLSNVQEFFMGRVSTKVMQMAREQAVCVVN